MTSTYGIDVATLRERLAGDEPPRVLDVRTPAEFRTAHIPGAYNVPLDILREHRAELLGHLDEQAVLVCRGGDRARQAERALAEAGLPNLRVLGGGMLAWTAAGAPVVAGKATWELERQVRLVAGGIVALAVLVDLVVPGLRWVAAGVGTGLVVAALTNTCAMGALLAKLPYNRGPHHDVTTIIARLASTAPGGRTTVSARTPD